MRKNIVIVGGARDYHAVDWYRTLKKILDKKDINIIFLTDLIAGEGFKKIVTEDDNVQNLFIIDKFLCKTSSKLCDKWRNIFKLLILPLQVYFLKKFHKTHPNSIYHAHPMYYMFLCMIAKVPYIGTPQGSEILIRMKKSFLYRFFAKKAIKTAKFITVDSLKMQEEIKKETGVVPILIQNGIDTKTILKYSQYSKERKKIISIRGFTSLYRIHEVLLSRNKFSPQEKIYFIYPFFDKTYKEKVKKLMSEKDEDIGKLEKHQMYSLLSEAKLVISIPKSDSSPRSVYEAIFAGAPVATVYDKWIDLLPNCMKERLIIVDLKNKDWFKIALEKAEYLCKKPFIPTKEAIEMFDQYESIKKHINTLYGVSGQ